MGRQTRKNLLTNNTAARWLNFSCISWLFMVPLCDLCVKISALSALKVWKTEHGGLWPHHYPQCSRPIYMLWSSNSIDCLIIPANPSSRNPAVSRSWSPINSWLSRSLINTARWASTPSINFSAYGTVRSRRPVWDIALHPRQDLQPINNYWLNCA